MICIVYVSWSGIGGVVLCYDRMDVLFHLSPTLELDGCSTYFGVGCTYYYYSCWYLVGDTLLASWA